MPQSSHVEELQEENARLLEEIENLEKALVAFGFDETEIDKVKLGQRFGKVMSEGATRIVKERIRQITVEGWDADHDDQHIHGDLAVHAAGLAVYGTDAIVDDPRIELTPADIHDEWGLIQKHKDDPERMLEIAGALIAAELDRVIRSKQ